MTASVKRTVTVDVGDLTISALEEFCATARRDGADDRAAVRLAEVAPFIKRYRLQVVCPPNTPKES